MVGLGQQQRSCKALQALCLLMCHSLKKRPIPQLSFAVSACLLTRPVSWWRFYKRLQLQNVITEHGFGRYQGVLYGGTTLILVLLSIVLWLHFVLRTKTKFRWQWWEGRRDALVCNLVSTQSYLASGSLAAWV